ncbi:RNA polymerase sigma factor [Pararhodonellum marinum]|uniref:RNA polymerase sigma factor n=1 Tax=Pararhodonellum marinum TaxID=2755358 RepID=UPI0018908CBE|nr:RNA polymerase sigma factor [Pararhodonellum marinum]
MNNPFQSIYIDKEDNELIAQARDGSNIALETLIKKHQHYIYNVALKMTLSPIDAEDITQEVLIKVITNLAQFKGESHFRTWLYRITFNHFLKMKKVRLEDFITSFDQYGQELDQMENVELSAMEKAEMKEWIEEANISCMSGMLLCLDREQRLVYILGDIFGVDHKLGSQMLEISKDNFRQRLSRARRDLYQFMNNKCGLVNKTNPCRCDRKTKSFIKAGWVDPDQMKYNTSYLKKIAEEVSGKAEELCDLTESEYVDLFRKHPFQEKEHQSRLFAILMKNDKITKLFNLK